MYNIFHDLASTASRLPLPPPSLLLPSTGAETYVLLLFCPHVLERQLLTDTNSSVKLHSRTPSPVRPALICSVTCPLEPGPVVRPLTSTVQLRLERQLPWTAGHDAVFAAQRQAWHVVHAP